MKRDAAEELSVIRERNSLRRKNDTQAGRIQRYRDLALRQERIFEYAISALTEAHTQLAAKGCWCPGAGDEVCTLHVVQDALAVLKSRTLPGDRWTGVAES